MRGNTPSGNPNGPALDRTRRSLLKARAGLGLLTLAGLPGRASGRGPEPILVFHAGSLAPPFSAAEPRFEEATGIPARVTRVLPEEASFRVTLGLGDPRLDALNASPPEEGGKLGMDWARERAWYL